VDEIAVVDASAERWDDVAAVMGTRGDPARCWCQFFRLTNTQWQAGSVGDRRAALKEQAADPMPPGVLAFLDGNPTGWCGLAPRAAYPRLATSLVSKATDDEDGLWSVTCFVVSVGARRRGLSDHLLAGAIDLARRHGARLLEAYPIDVAVRSPSSSELYHGAFHVFRRAGFVEVARPKPERPVVRLRLERGR
jgi:ribosomal protein S18 acetylase RimI-like enzyme